MNLESIKKAYGRYARYYDTLFGAIMHPGRMAIMHAIDCMPGQRVLEVGVGTGLSLPHYPTTVKVTGIDISTEMLAKARHRVALEGLMQIEALIEMDAEYMQFPDNAFDKVVAMYVASVVPDPVRFVDEMRRVCKPDGEIFIVNHFRSKNPLMKTVECMLAPLSKLAGFRPDLDLDRFREDTGLDVVEMRSANLFGYWKVLRCRKQPVRVQAGERAGGGSFIA
jgi:phosphatidylethanolamine/phosphatidyl-N-methylethanolamine N-methyltransferase